MIKKRKICARCGAKKYTKYLKLVYLNIKTNKTGWICASPSKCRNRGANYKK